MNALTFHGKHEIVYESIADPQIEVASDVIVRMKLCAICGSDLHVYHEHEKGIDHATAMGHEFIGEIIEIGKEVRSLKAGDFVMSPFSTSCGKCFYCLRGLTSRCVYSQLFGWVENGKGLQGAQAEFIRVPMAESTLMKIPESINQEEALLLGDVIPTGYFCALQAEIKFRNVYVVIGCGPVGIMTIIGAIDLGAEKIFAIDTLETRLEMAAKYGATPVNALKANPIMVIKEATEGRGADGVMEAVGNAATAKLAYDLVRAGGIISMVGVCNDEHMSFSPAQAYNKNLTFKVGRCPARYLMDKVLPIVESRRYNFTDVVTHRMPLVEGAQGYNLFANQKESCLKIILSR